MRILLIAFALSTVEDDSVGGAEQIVRLLDRGLVEAEHESYVVAAANSQVSGTLYGTACPPSVITKGYYSFRDSEQKRKIREALDSLRIDLVHMHGYDFHEFIPQGEIPVLATLHLPTSWYPESIYRMERANFYMNCVSNSQYKTAPKSEHILPVIENGVDLPALRPLPASSRKGAVMLGRICADKGIHIGIAAARKARIPLTIAGQVFGYPEHLRYMREQVEPELDENIRLVGPVGKMEKIELLRSAKCLLVPSLVPETSSLVAMEALACGTPVIAFNSGALPEIVEHGKTGFIVNSAEEIADTISAVIDIGPENCRQAALTRFNAARMVNEYLELYQELIALSKRASLVRDFSAESQYRGTA